MEKSNPGIQRHRQPFALATAQTVRPFLAMGGQTGAYAMVRRCVGCNTTVGASRATTNRNCRRALHQRDTLATATAATRQVQISNAAWAGSSPYSRVPREWLAVKQTANVAAATGNALRQPLTHRFGEGIQGRPGAFALATRHPVRPSMATCGQMRAWAFVGRYVGCNTTEGASRATTTGNRRRDLHQCDTVAAWAVGRV
jgi:hypothetical protein